MKVYRYIILSLVITALPISAIAESIYKSVDENGATVFSDKKTSDAKKIDVQPNVVNVDIPNVPISTPKNVRKPTVMQTGTHKNSGQDQPVEMGSGTATAGNLKRRIRNQTNGEGINRPVAKPAARSGGRR